MTKIGYLSCTIRTFLMATVLIPAPLLAEPAATARQMLTQAQTRAQDHAVKSEVKKITERGPVPTETPALKSFSSAPQELGAIPAVSALTAEANIEPPSKAALTVLRDDGISVPPTTPADPQFALRAAAYQIASNASLETPKSQVDTASIVTSPPSATTADTAQVAPVATMAAATTSLDTPALPPAPETQPATIKMALAKTDRPPTEGNTVPATAETRSETGRNVASKSEVAVRPAVKKTSASTRIANSSPETHKRHTRANSAVEFHDSNIRLQLQRIINRPEVRSLMAQYGLN
jgi:hypothetical protein